MATPNSRPLMRQKVNVGQELLESYKRNMAHELRNVIHKSPLEFSDYGRAFEHKERTFEIFGFTENSHVILREMHEGNPLFIELPASVELVVTYTEPGLQGDRSSGGTKPATVETGIEVQVPLFIKQDEKVLVDTRDGSYQGRAN